MLIMKAKYAIQQLLKRTKCETEFSAKIYKLFTHTTTSISSAVIAFKLAKWCNHSMKKIKLLLNHDAKCKFLISSTENCS